MKHVTRLLFIAMGIATCVVVAWLGVVLWLAYLGKPPPLADQCIASAFGVSSTIDPEQAMNASIIADLAVKRGLDPQAAVIALATAMQESDLRNLSHGDRDSLGLFQQRPSQGWGTEAQIMDPYYSTNAFYDALLKVANWKTRDVTEVAQAVQRSAFPNGYRPHVPEARVLAGALTGTVPASLTCAFVQSTAADPQGLSDFLVRNLGTAITVQVKGGQLQIQADSTAHAWAAAHAAVANAGRFGVVKVTNGTRVWRVAGWWASEWTQGMESTQIAVTLRS